VYDKLAVQKERKTGMTTFVFWDAKCLNYGQDWEKGFLNGIKTSHVIVLLVSNKGLEGIKASAHKRQDNVLVEYECALIQNKLHKVPVLPVFVAEITGVDTHGAPAFEKVNLSIDFPDVPHLRNNSSKAIVDNLSKGRHETGFLKSIKQTMEEIFRLQGYFLTKRGEEKEDLDTLIEVITATLSKTVQGKKLTLSRSGGGSTLLLPVSKNSTGVHEESGKGGNGGVPPPPPPPPPPTGGGVDKRVVVVAALLTVVTIAVCVVVLRRRK